MSNPIVTNGVPDVGAESIAWESRCAEVTAERDRLREEIEKVKSERDSYLKSLYYFLRKEAPPPDFTKEEMLAFVGQEPPLEDFIAELEREMRADTPWTDEERDLLRAKACEVLDSFGKKPWA